MKNLILFLSLFAIFCFSGTLHGQFLNSVSFAPNPALSCSTITATVNGDLSCLNTNLDSISHNITGSVVTINIYHSIGPICLPAIAPFSYPRVLGMIPAGTYTLNVQTYLNSTAFNNLTIPLPIGSCCSVNTSFAATANAVCPGDTIDFTANNTNLLNYTWKVNGNTISTTSQANQIFSMPGNYAVTFVGNDSTCLDSTTLNVVVPVYPQLTFSQVTGESCPGRMDGSIDLSATGGLGSLGYAWSSGATTQDLSSLSGGTYVVTVTDSIGCASVDSATILTGLAVTSAFSPSRTLICTNDTVTLTNTGTGGANFAWFSNGTQFSSASDTVYSFAAAGTYSISLVSSNTTCFDTAASVNITVQPSPTFTLIPSPEACHGASDGSINLAVFTGVPPYTYLWSNGDTTEDLSNVAGGTYTVTITDSLGCTDTDMATVTSGMGITASFSVNTNTSICPGTQVSFTNTSSGGNIYSWLVDTSMFATTANASYTFTQGGIFNVYLQISDGVCKDTASQAFMVSDAPNLTPTVTDETCPGDMDGTITLNVTGGVSPFIYSWSNGAVMKDISGLDPGDYELLIRDGIGCEIKDTFSIVTLGGLTADFSYLKVGTLDYQFTDMSDTTVVSWLWDFGDGNTSMMQDPLHNFSSGGNYVVCLTSTDQYGCEDIVCDTIPIIIGNIQLLTNPSVLYPNPVKNLCYLDLGNISGQMVQIEVMDAMGRKVYFKETYAEKKTTVDLSFLTKGWYGLRVVSEKGFYLWSILKE